MTMLVRATTLKDLDVIAELFDGYRQFYGQASDLALAKNFISARLTAKDSVIFLAVDDTGHALGFVQLYPSYSSVSARRIWILNDLFVAAHRRGQGIGQLLLQATRQHGLETGAKRIVLATAHDNPAQKLYEANGYQRDAHFLHYSLELS